MEEGKEFQIVVVAIQYKREPRKRASYWRKRMIAIYTDRKIRTEKSY